MGYAEGLSQGGVGRCCGHPAPRGVTIKQIVRDFGILEGCSRNCLRQARSRPVSGGVTVARSAQMRALRKRSRNRMLEMDNEVLQRPRISVEVILRERSPIRHHKMDCNLPEQQACWRTPAIGPKTSTVHAALHKAFIVSASVIMRLAVCEPRPLKARSIRAAVWQPCCDQTLQVNSTA